MIGRQYTAVEPGIVENVKKSVTFIFINEKNNGEDVFKANGTGFFVAINLEKDPTRVQVYLVTAKHVLQDRNGNFFEDMIIRLNLRSGGIQLIRVPLDSGRMFTHEDPDVDIVVYPMAPDAASFDYQFILPQYFATKEVIKERQISEGEDVFFMGLFESHIGIRQNQPIMRFGKLSLLTEEKIEWRDRERGSNESPKFVDLYLMECLSFGGNSGSPVFFYLSPTRRSNELVIGGPLMYLAGIIKGSYQQTDILRYDTFSKQNMGIAAVTPTFKLQEILFSDSLKNFRGSGPV